ncbi:L,D-transpeptidase family protein [Novosphingobium resinovorum]
MTCPRPDRRHRGPRCPRDLGLPRRLRDRRGGGTAGHRGQADPLGIFPITQKDKDHVSNIYTGAPMPYMQRLTNDGITLHGSDVALGYASHGCVGMPDAFAAKLFDTTKIGDKVYITKGKQVGMGDSLVGVNPSASARAPAPWQSSTRPRWAAPPACR